MVILGDLQISYFSYSHDNAQDDFLPLAEELMVSPLWVLATPLYWYSVSAQAKTFIDRLSDLLSFRKALGHGLRGKSLAVLCSGTDEQLPSSFEQPFELTTNYLGMRYLGTFYAQFSGAELVHPTSTSSAKAFGHMLLQEAANPSIERTSSSTLRVLPAAAHVER